METAPSLRQQYDLEDILNTSITTQPDVFSSALNSLQVEAGDTLFGFVDLLWRAMISFHIDSASNTLKNKSTTMDR